MQVNETTNEGLKRAYTVTVGADEIDSQVQARLVELGQNIRVPGFRPGKVPMTILRQRYASAVMGEVLDKTVRETTEKVITDHELRPAAQPELEVTSFDEGKDLEFTVAMEVLPDVGDIDLSKVSVERLVVEATDTEVDNALARIAEQNTGSEAVTSKRKSKAGDIAVIDFHGKIDGVDLPGGQGADHPLELGSGQFIPGFEDQVIGAKAGDEVTVNVTFPEDYHAEDLAGKAAEFKVNVKELREPKPADIDDELAKKVGLENLEALKKAVREQLESEYKKTSRAKAKQRLLDALADVATFDVPTVLVDNEFDEIWKQIEHAKEHDHLDEEDKGKSDDELKEEYQGVAERRVRLGILLSEIGRKHEIQVTPEDFNQAILAEASKYPGQEQAVFQYFTQNEQARQQLQAPIYEDKVVDFILELADVKDKTVTIEELYAADEAPAKKPAAKKAAAKKTPAKKAPAKKPAAKAESGEKTPAKKAPAKKPAAKKSGE